MNFKTPLARLVRYLFQSREKWKARALENQQELRKIQVKTRDLEVSRKQWKKRAQQAEKELSLVKQSEQNPAKADRSITRRGPRPKEHRRNALRRTQMAQLSGCRYLPGHLPSGSCLYGLSWWCA